MSKKLLGVVLIVFFIGLCVQGLAEEKKAKPQLYAVWEEIVPPDQISAHEAAIKKIKAFHTKIKSPYGWNISRTDDVVVNISLLR